MNDGNWHLLAATYDGSGAASGIQLYLDGAAVGTNVRQNTLGGGTTLNNAPVTIGARDTGGLPFNGTIDEAAIFGAALSSAQIRQIANDAVNTSRLLPQFAFGGGWYSALYFTNTGTSAVSFPVNFIGDDGNPLVVPPLGGNSVILNLSPRGTAVIEAPNTGPLTQGYVSITLPGGVAAYGVFRQSVAGRSDQEAVVPLSASSSTTNTLIFDDTAFVTGVAIVNLSAVTNTVSITIRNSAGVTTGVASILIPARGKLAVNLRDIPGLGGVLGTRGSADFTVATGNIAVLGLRFKDTSFTSIPASER